MRRCLLVSLTLLAAVAGLSASLPAHAAPKPEALGKERLVLMPLRVSEADKELQGDMEAALVEGLASRYEVFSGEQVQQKARQIFSKETRAAKHECDETRCMQGIAEAFQAELIGVADVKKRSDGYFLALTIQNIFDNKVVYSKSTPCEGCNAYRVVEKLKELAGNPTGTSAERVAATLAEPKMPALQAADPEADLWDQVQKGNSVEDYNAYLARYPSGRFAVLAHARISKLERAAPAEGSTGRIGSGPAVVNGVVIPQARLELLVRSAISQGQTDSPDLRRAITDQLIRQELLAQEATKMGLDKQPDAILSLNQARRSALAQAYIEYDVRNHRGKDEKATQQAVLKHIEELRSGAAISSSSEGTATVNGILIPKALIDFVVKSYASQGQADTPDLRKRVLDELIKAEVVSQQAVKMGLDKQPETEQQIDMSRLSVLANAYVQEFNRNHPAGDDEIKRAYNMEQKKAGSSKHQYRAAHILVTTEPEAKTILAQLRKGAQFEKLAKEKSLEPNSKDKGGDLDWHLPSDFPEPFSQAMVKLKKGELSVPVQTQYGWHIIKLEDVRQYRFPPLEEVRAQLTQRLQQEAMQKSIADLVAKAKIELH